MAVTKVGRHSPTPSMEAAEQRAFARSERRRGVREGTGGAGRRAAAWRGRPASPIPALTLPGAGIDGSVTSAGGTGGRPKGSARSEMPGRWRASVLSWKGSSSRRGPQFRQARSEAPLRGDGLWGGGEPVACRLRGRRGDPCSRPLQRHSTVGHYAIARLHPYTPGGGLGAFGWQIYFSLSSRPLQCCITPLHAYTLTPLCSLFLIGVEEEKKYA